MAVVVIVTGMTLVTMTRVERWGDSLALWAEAATHNPGKPRPWIQYGVQLDRHQDPGGAEQAFQWALTQSLRPERIRVEGPMRAHDVARLNLALILAERGEYAKALAFTAAIQPRADPSRVTQLERQWRDEQTRGGPGDFVGF